MKAFAEDKLNVAQIMTTLWEKGENAGILCTCQQTFILL